MKKLLVSMQYLVYMQGFKQSGDDYILKELAIMPLNDDTEPLVLLFNKPYSRRRLSDEYKEQNTWLKYYYHGLSWNSGTIPYTDVGNILREALRDATKIFVVGRIRKKWLERFKFKVCDVTEMGFPPTDKIKLVTVCPNHND
ncbi:hypothetical protein, partial [Escherichia coli]|uniref:hypothetical protein n=1 Tax=Escherichia coli TaxID=562 RepID=UPI002916B771